MSLPVEVLIPSVQTIGCGMVYSWVWLEVDSLIHIVRESTPLAIVAPATLKMHTESFRLIALSEAIGCSAVARIATGSPIPAVSHR